MKPDQLLHVLAAKASTIGPRGESLAQKLIHANSRHQDFWSTNGTLPSLTTSNGTILLNSATGNNNVNASVNSDLNFASSNHLLSKKTYSLPRNYYGLPPIANPITSDNLLANCRKPRLATINDESKESSGTNLQEQKGLGTDNMTGNKVTSTMTDSNVDAQRKVAISLLTMAKNEVNTFLDKLNETIMNDNVILVVL